MSQTINGTPEHFTDLIAKTREPFAKFEELRGFL
jgi:hypothetical protein